MTLYRSPQRSCPAETGSAGHLTCLPRRCRYVTDGHSSGSHGTRYSFGAAMLLSVSAPKLRRKDRSVRTVYQWRAGRAVSWARLLPRQAWHGLRYRGLPPADRGGNPHLRLHDRRHRPLLADLRDTLDAFHRSLSAHQPELSRVQGCGGFTGFHHARSPFLAALLRVTVTKAAGKNSVSHAGDSAFSGTLL